MRLEEMAPQVHRYVHRTFLQPVYSGCWRPHQEGVRSTFPLERSELFTQFTVSASSPWLEVQHFRGKKQARNDLAR